MLLEHSHFNQHFHFFGNRELNALYLSLGLLHFGEGLISVFVPIYLWDLGYPLWQIFMFFFFHSFYFIVFAFLIIPLFRFSSDKMLMFLSIPFIVLYFFGLGFLDLYTVLFYILPLASALSLLLFNVGHNIDFTRVSNNRDLGKEVGVRFLTNSLASFSAPFLGGILIAYFGFQITFFIGSIILFIAVVPLMFFPKRKIGSYINSSIVMRFIKNRSLLPFTWSGVGFATEKMIATIVWPIFIFLAVGSFEKFGGVASIGLFASAIVTFLAGSLSDTGKRKVVLTLSTIGYSAIWIARVLYQIPIFIVGSHFGGNMVRSGIIVAWSSQYFHIARNVHNLGAFVLSREVLYNFARIIFLPILSIIAFYLSIETFFSVSFVMAGVLSLFFLFSNGLRAKNMIG